MGDYGNDNRIFLANTCTGKSDLDCIFCCIVYRRVYSYIQIDKKYN